MPALGPPAHKVISPDVSKVSVELRELALPPGLAAGPVPFVLLKKQSPVVIHAALVRLSSLEWKLRKLVSGIVIEARQWRRIPEPHGASAYQLLFVHGSKSP